MTAPNTNAELLATNLLKLPFFNNRAIPDAAALLRQQDQDIERLRNELSDALDCKNGAGPTALAVMWDSRDALAAENKVLREDAARYRWLRIQDDEDFCFAVVKNPHFDIYEASELDAAIDAALTKEATNG